MMNWPIERMPVARVEAVSMYVVGGVNVLTIPVVKSATILTKIGLSNPDPLWAMITSFTPSTRVFLAKVELTYVSEKVVAGIK
jgi:hypothetical protein